MRAKHEYTVRMEKQKEVSYGTRYPQEVLEQMRLLARQHGRSLNSEIVWALREYIARQKGEHTDADKQKDQA